MNPVNRSEITDLYIWSEIQYLDPDLQPAPKHRPPEPTRKSNTRTWRLFVTLIAVLVLAGAVGVRYLPLLVKRMK